MALSKLMSIVISITVLIVAIVIFLSIFNPTKGSVQDAVNNFADSFGTEQISGSKPELPAAQQQAISSLTSTIRTMISAERNNCFMKYSGLPDLGEEGTSLLFSTEGSATSLTILGGAGGKQVVDKSNIANLQLCVGLDDGNNWFTSSPANKVQLSYNGENTILADYDPNNLEVLSFNDNGWLYKDNNGRICFFPTSGEGIGEDILHGDEIHPFSVLERMGRVYETPLTAEVAPLARWCQPQPGQDDEFFIYNSIELAGDYVEVPAEVNRLSVIKQTCQGIVGKDCRPTYQDCNDQLVFTQGSGCVLTIAENEPFYSNDNCASGTAVEGQIIPTISARTTLPSTAGKINLIGELTTTDPENEAVKMFQETGWYGFRDQSLLCQNQQWFACDDFSVGKAVNNYNCNLVGGTYLWEEIN